MTTWDWVKVILVVTAVISLTEVLGIRLAGAAQRAQMKVGLTILPSASNPVKSGAKASSATPASTKTRCPQQDSSGSINLKGKSWAC